LLRSRAVAGEMRIRRMFEDVRLDVLCHHVRRESLRDEVRRMRERMRAELQQGAFQGQFDISRTGGIADIEFSAQYCVRWAGTIRRWSCFPTRSASSNPWHQ
jgi:glutamate-ammonia-ligase adenylyltransferase